MRDPQISSTTSLVSLVGTQLGQTLLTGDSRDLKVIAASVLSAAGLLAIVQTPPLSSRVGSTPLTPVDLGIAIGTSVASSVASAVVPRERRQGLLDLPKRLKRKAGDFLDFLIEQT